MKSIKYNRTIWSRIANIFFIDLQNRRSVKNASSWSQDIHNNWWKTGSLNIQQFIMSWWCIGNFTINYELSINWFFILCNSMILLFLSQTTHSIPALNYDKNKQAEFLQETECWALKFLVILWPDTAWSGLRIVFHNPANILMIFLTRLLNMNI